MVLKSEDVNYLVYRYLKESGFLHSSYTFQFESQLHKAQAEQPNVEPGALIRVLQKGLQYMDVETHLNEDGTARLCTAPFTLVGKHTCSVQPPTPPDTRPSTKPKETSNTAAHGGHTLVHDASRKSNKPKVNSIDNETAADDVEEEDRMDVDVPDTESNTQKALKKSRSVDRVEYLSGHTAAVFLCAWNPALPATLATGSGDGTVRLWDAAARQNSAASVAVLRHSSHEGRADVTALCWNPQGTLLATVSFAGHLRLWSAQGDLRATLRNRPVPVVAMKWNRRGTLLAAACLDGSISLWETPSGRLRHEYRGHTGSVLDVDWHDGLLASCAADRTIIIWRDSDTTPLKTLVGHTADVNAISWHPTGKYLASASDDGSLRIWTPQSDTPLQHEFLGHSQQVYSVKWLPRSDKAIIASASFDGTIRIWDAMHTASCIRVLSGHSEAVHCLSFSADGKYLASGSFDKRVCVWYLKDGSIFKSFVADDGIHDVQWASKGKIAVAIANSQVAIFDPLLPVSSSSVIPPISSKYDNPKSDSLS